MSIFHEQKLTAVSSETCDFNKVETLLDKAY